MINIIKKSFFLFLLVFSSLIAKQDYNLEHQPAALEKAFDLPHQGVLKQKENGYVYLDVSNEFITSIVPFIDLPGDFRARPTASRSLGAHIGVFHEQENIVPEELGSTFSFDVKDIRSFTLHTRDGLKKLWVIALDSPELKQLREKYGLYPKLKDYDFHITLGKQMPATQENCDTIETLSPFNYSEEPTDGLFAKGDFKVVEDEAILLTASKVNAIGQLKLKGNGFAYLDVNNQFVDELITQLPLKHEFCPVSTKPKKMGAHISVIYEDEMIGNEIWNFKEAGQWFTFEAKELRYVDRKTSKGTKRLWLLAIDSPALQRLRVHYGLKPKLKGHDLHITLGNELLDTPRKEISEVETKPSAA